MISNELIETGLSLPSSNPHHDLCFGFRCQVYGALDQPAGPARELSGWFRRIRLAVLSVEKGLPIWDSAFPQDHGPREALKLVDQIWTGTISQREATQRSGDLWTHCDNLCWKHENKQDRVMIGYEAAQAVREAISPDDFRRQSSTSDATDIDIDPYDLDSSFLTSIAYADGPPWMDTSSSDKRLAFWTWWLTTAVKNVAE